MAMPWAGTRHRNPTPVTASPRSSLLPWSFGLSRPETDWIELPKEGRVHCFTVCHFGSQEFLPECPFVLALIEFEGFDSLFLTRLLGVDPLKPSLDWVGMKVKPKYRRLSKIKPTDVYFVPAE